MNTLPYSAPEWATSFQFRVTSSDPVTGSLVRDYGLMGEVDAIALHESLTVEQSSLNHRVEAAFAVPHAHGHRGLS